MAKPCLDPTLDEVKDGWPRARARLARMGLGTYPHWDTGPHPGDPGGPGIVGAMEPAPPREGFGRLVEWVNSKILEPAFANGVTSKVFAPRMVAGNDPALKGVIDAAGQMEAMVNRTYAKNLREFGAAWQGVPKEELAQVTALYQTYGKSPEFYTRAAAISPTVAAAAERWRPIVAEHWDFLKATNRVKLDAEPIPHYLPQVRETVVLNQVLGLGTAEDTTSRLIFKQLPNDEGFQPEPWLRMLGRSQPFFAKYRGLEEATPLVPFQQVLDIYARSQAHMRARDQFVEAIRPLLPMVSPAKLTYTMHYVNTVLGQPGSSSELWRNMSGLLRVIESSRLLGYNLAAAIRNLTQPMDLALAGVSYKNVGLGFMDSFNPQIAAMAEAAGLPVANAAAIRADLPAVAQNGGVMQTLRAWVGGESVGLLGKLTNPLALFQAAERRNLLHSFASGLREAADHGLSGNEALRFAMGIVDRTQYSFRATRTPLAFQGPTGSLIGQMKTFDLNRWGLLRDAAVNRPLDFAKWVVGATVLFGPDVIYPGLDEVITKRMFGESMKIPGIVPYIGGALAQAVNLPGVGPDDVRRFFAMLPGPAIANAADAATFLDFMVRGTKAIDFGKLIAGDKTAAFEGGVSYDRAAAAGTRSLPFFGVAADRGRRALRTWQAEGDVRESLDFAEAFGVRPAGAFNTLQDQQSTLEQVLTFTGLTPDRVLQAQAALRAEQDLTRSEGKLRAEAHKLLLAGRVEEAFAAIQPLLEAGEPINLGRPTPQQMLKSLLPPAERLLLGPAGKSPAAVEALTPSPSVFDVLRNR